MTLVERFDVAVIGSGPAGSTTAALLARRGFSIGLFDAAQFPRDKPCAEYCNPGVRELLQRSGAWPEVARLAVATPGMKLVVHGRPVLDIRYGGEVSIPAFSLPRKELDFELLGHAARRGAKPYEGHRLTRMKRIQSGFRLDFTKVGTEEVQSIETRFLVAADGIHSKTARLLGISAGPVWPRRLGLVTHYEIDGDLQCGEMHVGDGTYCGLAPLGPRTVSVGLVVDLGEARTKGIRSQRLPEWALQRLPQVHHLLSGGRQLKPVTGVGPMSRRVSRVAGDGFLLVGDAAGFLDPFTGEGLYRALKSAGIAAGVLDSALTSGATNLSDYAHLRRQALSPKERVAWVIQAALTRPVVLEGLASRFQSSQAGRQAIGNVLGDIGPISKLAQPNLLRSLVRSQVVTSPSTVRS